MKSKNIISVLMFFLILIVLTSSVSAYGLTPARKIISFEPGLKTEIELSALSTGDEQVFFTLKLAGALEQYAELNTKSLILDYGETRKSFKVKLDLPKELPPGPNILEVQLFDQNLASTATVSVKNVIVAEIVVNVPYEGVHVDTKLNIEHGKVNEPLKFTISLFGRGNAPANCYSKININNPEGEFVDSIVSEKVHISQGESNKIELFWTKTENKGLYVAEAQVYCEDKTYDLKDLFYIGDPSLTVLSITSNKFILGEIAPIDIAVRNNWNERFNEVLVEILVLGEADKILQQFKSATEGVDPDEVKVLRSYWETQELQVGKYNLNVVTYFDYNGMVQKRFVANIQPKSLEVTQFTGQITGADDSSYVSLSKVSVLLIILIILIAINVGVVIYFKTKKK